MSTSIPLSFKKIKELHWILRSSRRLSFLIPPPQPLNFPLLFHALSVGALHLPYPDRDLSWFLTVGQTGRRMYLVNSNHQYLISLWSVVPLTKRGCTYPSIRSMYVSQPNLVLTPNTCLRFSPFPKLSHTFPHSSH